MNNSTIAILVALGLFVFIGVVIIGLAIKFWKQYYKFWMSVNYTKDRIASDISEMKESLNSMEAMMEKEIKFNHQNQNYQAK